jgi:tetratricopeptide (TPR) repeat protein
MGLAVTLEKGGHYPEAQREFAAAAASTDEREANVARQGEALVALRAALAAKPSDQGFLDLAQQYVRTGDLYEAVRLLERRAAEQSSPQILEGLASLYLQAGMVDHGVAAAQQLVALEPQSAAGPYYLLDAYLKQNRLDEAQVQLEAALRLDDKSANLWLQAARLARLRGRDAECAEALRKTLALGGPSTLALARQDPLLGGTAAMQEVWRAYVAGAGGTGSPK